MILLDTNIVSEGIRQKPSVKVRAWLDAQPTSSIYLCTPVLAELRYGVERLIESERKSRLRTWVDHLETDIYLGRILPLDVIAAHEFGRISATRERIGRRIEAIDGLIAAIAITNGMVLATRDINDFAGINLELVNPFEASAA